MRTLRSCLGLVFMVALSACIATVWDRPGMTPAEFNMDSAQCQLYGEGAVQDFDTGTISTGHFKRDLAANAAVGLIGAIAQGVGVSQKHDLRMAAKGYVARAVGAPPVVPPVQPAYAGVKTVTVGAGPLPISAPQVPNGPVTLRAFGPPAAAVCPPGFNPRWTNTDIGKTPIMFCIKGSKYPEFLWWSNGLIF